MEKCDVQVNELGTVRYYKKRTPRLHSLDGPAVEYADGTKSWCQDGKLHRTDGPAIVYPSGTKQWYQNDKLHRIDGPAIVYADGTVEYRQNGKLHRTDGPAVEWAVEWASGTVEYWIDDKELTLAQFKEKTTPVKEMTVAEIEAVLGHSVKIIK